MANTSKRNSNSNVGRVIKHLDTGDLYTVCGEGIDSRNSTEGLLLGEETYDSGVWNFLNVVPFGTTPDDECNKTRILTISAEAFGDICPSFTFIRKRDHNFDKWHKKSEKTMTVSQISSIQKKKEGV